MSNKEVVKESFGGKIKKKVSEFFLHLMAYGGLSFENGVIYMWGDPYIFIPLESFFILQKDLKKLLKKEGIDLLYWLGKLSGKNATIALVTRYGLDINNLADFVNGATQDGFGYFEIKDVDLKSDPMMGHLISKNCSISDVFLNKKIKSGVPVDYYICGLLAGGTEPLVKTNVIGKEIYCKAKGENECLFELVSSKKKETPKFFNKCKITQEDLEKKSLKLYLRRKRPSKFLGKKEYKVHFGDGTFYLNGIRGVVIASYIILILNKLLGELASDKACADLMDSFCKISIEEISSEIPLPKKRSGSFFGLDKALDSLKIFGFGKFNLKYSQKNTFFIENINNTYPKDHLFLFGKSKKSVDIIPIYLLKYFFEFVTKMEVDVIEKKCISQGSKSCLFQVTLK